MKLLLILLLLNFKVFAKTVKFHAPQTEAEKALDLILNGSAEENNLSKQFIRYRDIEIQKTQKTEECIKYGECQTWTSGYINCQQDEPLFYLFKTAKCNLKSDMCHIYVQSAWFNNKFTLAKYIMKYEDKIWKLHGFYCNEVGQLNYHPTHSTLDFDK